MAFGNFWAKLTKRITENPKVGGSTFSASLKYVPGEIEQAGAVVSVGKTVTLVTNNLKNPRENTEERTQIPIYTGNPFRPMSS